MKKKNLLFVHGWCTDSKVWERSISKLGEERKDITSYSINLPGHGGSRPWNLPTFAPALKELEEVTSTLDYNSIIGVGWSLGAEVLLSAAVKDKRFKALVLVGASPCFVGNEHFPYGHSSALVKRMIHDLNQKPEQTIERFLKLNFTHEELVTDEAAAFIETYGSPEQVVSEYDSRRMVPASHPIFAYDELATALGALHDTDLRGLLKDIKIPVLVLHGDADSVCPIRAGRYLATEIKGAEIKIYKNTGHGLFIMERARFEKDLLEFIDRLK
jgi:pimeloyl-[acyl-carrier protein] methyl ester esterase